MPASAIKAATLGPHAPSLDADLALVAVERCTWCGSTNRRHYRRAKVDGPLSAHGWLHCQQCGFWNSDQPVGGDVEVNSDDYVYEQDYLHRLAHKLRSAHHRLHVLENLCGKRGRMLDIGCSYGSMLLAAVGRGWDADGVDLSTSVVLAARELGVSAQVGSLTQLPFADQTFDLINVRHVIEHDVNTYRACAEMQRVAKPGALVLIETPDAACLRFRRRLDCQAATNRHWTVWHRVLFTPEVLAGFCQRLGWRQVMPSDWQRGGLSFQGWWLFNQVLERSRLASRIVTYWRVPGEEDGGHG